ncbi:outer membrane beta-barrel protein [Candidatus Cloacimonadota bacterium]
MKRVILIFCAVLITMISLHSDISLGIIGGLNFADLDPYVDGLSKKAEAINKSCFGLLFDVDISEYFTFRFEPMYIKKGGKILDALRDIDDVPMKINCSYIELPFFIKTNHLNSLNLYILGGPVFSFLLDCEADIDIYYGDDLGDITFNADLMDVTKNFDLGIGIGGGFKIPFNRISFYGEARYVRGLMNAREAGDVTIKGEYDGEIITETVTMDAEDNKYANQGAQLLLGVTFTL